MRLNFLLLAIPCLASICCNKSNACGDSKTDFIPIITAASPTTVRQGEPIQSKVTCGFYEYFADVTFLRFDVTQTLQRQYEVRAKARYSDIMQAYSLPVVSVFDTTLTLPTPVTGQYLLNFYNANKLVETD